MRSVIASLLLVAACGGTTGPGTTPGDDDNVTPDAQVIPPAIDTDPLSGLPTGPASWSDVCAKGYGDLVSKAFCASATAPNLTSLADLQTLLGLTVDPAKPQVGTSFTFAGHSTAIGGRFVTPLNPRVVMLTPPHTDGTPNAAYQVLAFSRGEPFVELAANDPTANNKVRFFLVRFNPGCEATGCNNADLLTPTIESGWTGYSLYDDSAIRNTTLDCLQCHQPGGPSTATILRMQEAKNPWGHWFYEERPENLQMEMDYLSAHTGEDYAGIPSSLIRPSRPFPLQFLVENNGFAAQPNAFPTLQIRTEIAANGTSPTWDAIYANSVNGTAIAVPYFATPTDPAKTQAAAQAYMDVRNGVLARDQMPDIRDIFLDSALSDLSYQPKAGLDGRGILKHMCQHCHNSTLDQTIGRAQFNVETLDTLSKAEKDEAIRRLQLDPTDRHLMPPSRFHSLSASERDLVIQELSK